MHEIFNNILTINEYIFHFIFVIIPFILLMLIYQLNKDNEGVDTEAFYKKYLSGFFLLVSLFLLIAYIIFIYEERNYNFMLIASIAPPIIGALIVSQFFQDKTVTKKNDSSEVEKQAVIMLTSAMTFIFYFLINRKDILQYDTDFALASLVIVFLFMMITLIALGVIIRDKVYPARKPIMFFHISIDSPDFKGGFFMMRALYIISLIFFTIEYNTEQVKIFKICYEPILYADLIKFRAENNDEFDIKKDKYFMNISGDTSKIKKKLETFCSQDFNTSKK